MSTRPHAPGRCRDLIVEVSTYLDGDLSPARASALERHLDDCPCCASFADSLRTAIATCRASGATRLPPAVSKRARERIAELLGSPAQAPRRQSARRPRAAGATSARSTRTPRVERRSR